MNDKRRGFLRVTCEQPVRFQPLTLDPEGKHLDLKGKMENVSLSGIFFEIKKADSAKALPYLKVSSLVWMEFTLIDHNSIIRTQGEIKRILSYSLEALGLGVMFVNLSQYHHRAIEEYISSQT